MDINMFSRFAEQGKEELLRPHAFPGKYQYKIYNSPSMQIFYFIIVIFCFFSTISNFFTGTASINYLNYIDKVLEILISFLITSEILLKIIIYSNRQSCGISCAEIFIVLLSLGTSVVILQEDLLEFLGDAVCNKLLVFRNLLYLGRLFILNRNAKKSQSQDLAENLYLNSDVLNRRLESAKIKFKYRPILDVLREEDENESDE